VLCLSPSDLDVAVLESPDEEGAENPATEVVSSPAATRLLLKPRILSPFLFIFDARSCVVLRGQENTFATGTR